MRKLILVPTVMLSLLAAAAIACGGDDNESSSSSSNAGPDRAATSAPAAAPAATTAPAVSAAPTVQKIALKSGENGQAYFFSQSEIKLKPGPVEVAMTNDGPDRPHDFVVKTLDGSANLVATERLQPGQSGTVTFTVVAGTYNFICSLPGHADRGAKGTLVVAN